MLLVFVYGKSVVTDGLFKNPLKSLKVIEFCVKKCIKKLTTYTVYRKSSVSACLKKNSNTGKKYNVHFLSLNEKTLLSIQNDCSQLFVFPKKITVTLILNTHRVQSDRFAYVINEHNIYNCEVKKRDNGNDGAVIVETDPHSPPPTNSVNTTQMENVRYTAILS